MRKINKNMKTFGTQNQMQFADDHEFFQFLGYLAKSDGSSSLVWEHNENQGAWGSEGRIHLYNSLPVAWNVRITAGNASIYGRINCNDFVEHICNSYGFVHGKAQNVDAIRTFIPSDNLSDFDEGLNL